MTGASTTGAATEATTVGLTATAALGALPKLHLQGNSSSLLLLPADHRIYMSSFHPDKRSNSRKSINFTKSCHPRIMDKEITEETSTTATTTSEEELRASGRSEA